MFAIDLIILAVQSRLCSYKHMICVSDKVISKLCCVLNPIGSF